MKALQKNHTKDEEERNKEGSWKVINSKLGKDHNKEDVEVSER